MVESLIPNNIKLKFMYILKLGEVEGKSGGSSSFDCPTLCLPTCGLSQIPFS